MFRFVRNVFSLTELLIVLAITVVLFSLLIPALTKNLDLARQIKCKQNLRGLGSVIIFYAEDFQGHLPSPNPYPRFARLWGNGYTDDIVLKITSAPDPNNIFGCPSEPSLESADPTRDTNNSSGYRGSHFGQSNYVSKKVFGEFFWHSKYHHYGYYSPSRSPVLGEAHACSLPQTIGMTSWHWSQSKAGANFNGTPDFLRHKDGKVGLYFMDGKVVRTNEHRRKEYGPNG